MTKDGDRRSVDPTRFIEKGATVARVERCRYQLLISVLLMTAQQEIHKILLALRLLAVHTKTTTARERLGRARANSIVVQACEHILAHLIERKLLTSELLLLLLLLKVERLHGRLHV